MTTYWQERFADWIDAAAQHTLYVLVKNSRQLSLLENPLKHRVGVFSNSLKERTSILFDNKEKYDLEFLRFINRFYETKHWGDVATPKSHWFWNQSFVEGRESVAPFSVKQEITEKEIKDICAPIKADFDQKLSKQMEEIIAHRHKCGVKMKNSEKEPDSLVLLERTVLEMNNTIASFNKLNSEADVVVKSLGDFAESLTND
jgi:hypothetical protein